jgi:hypothetical protein
MGNMNQQSGREINENENENENENDIINKL